MNYLQPDHGQCPVPSETLASSPFSQYFNTLRSDYPYNANFSEHHCKLLRALLPQCPWIKLLSLPVFHHPSVQVIRQGVRRCTFSGLSQLSVGAPFRTKFAMRISLTVAHHFLVCVAIFSTYWNLSDLSCSRDSWVDGMCTRVTLQWCKQRLFWPRPATVSSGARRGRQAWSSGVPYKLYTHIHRLQTGSTVLAPFIQLTPSFPSGSVGHEYWGDMQS